MGSKILKIVSCALVAGVFSAPSLARTFPYKNTGGVPSGIPEPGKYLMTKEGQRVGVPGVATAFGNAASFTGSGLGGSLSTGPAPESSARDLQNRFGSGTEINRLIPEVLMRMHLGRALSTVSPSTVQKDHQLLAVHIGTETVYVAFKNDAERKQYIANFKRDLAHMGLAIKSRARASAGKAEGSQPKP